jgi:nucleotide-binding universal stress UspA family protein
MAAVVAAERKDVGEYGGAARGGERSLRHQAAGQLRGRGADWEFERRQGLIADELIAVAAGIRDTGPGQGAVIVIGSSSHATHRVAGSVAVSLARHSPVPLVIGP